MGRSPSPLRIRRSARLYLIATAITVLVLLFILPLPSSARDTRSAFAKHVADVTKAATEGRTKTASTPSLEGTSSKHAFATFLANDPSHQNDSAINDDKYFVATRILGYQLLHAPETRSRNDTPFIVLADKAVSEVKKDRLRQDGAIVWEAEPIDPKWIHTEVSTWQAVLAKLRLWELDQFERICFLDGDTVLTKPLDGVFDDPAAQSQSNKASPAAVRKDEGKQPHRYVLAGVPEMNYQHHYPPTEEGDDFPNFGYLNAGFFVMEPSLALLDYYVSLTDVPGRFEPLLPEQNLLNYAHRPEGNMPWQHLDTSWNMHYPTVQDLEGGVASLHEKWWAPVFPDLGPYLESWRWRMEGFYEARDINLIEQTSRT